MRIFNICRINSSDIKVVILHNLNHREILLPSVPEAIRDMTCEDKSAGFPEFMKSYHELMSRINCWKKMRNKILAGAFDATFVESGDLIKCSVEQGSGGAVSDLRDFIQYKTGRIELLTGDPANLVTGAADFAGLTSYKQQDRYLNKPFPVDTSRILTRVPPAFMEALNSLYYYNDKGRRMRVLHEKITSVGGIMQALPAEDNSFNYAYADFTLYLGSGGSEHLTGYIAREPLYGKLTGYGYLLSGRMDGIPGKDYPGVFCAFDESMINSLQWEEPLVKQGTAFWGITENFFFKSAIREPEAIGTKFIAELNWLLKMVPHNRFIPSDDPDYAELLADVGILSAILDAYKENIQDSEKERYAVLTMRIKDQLKKGQGLGIDFKVMLEAGLRMEPVHNGEVVFDLNYWNNEKYFPENIAQPVLKADHTGLPGVAASAAQPAGTAFVYPAAPAALSDSDIPWP